MPTALVRRPGHRLADGLVTHQERVAVDADRAMVQWRGYVGALAEHGRTTEQVEPADEHPDAVFVEDAGVVIDDLAVVGRPGAASRQGEIGGASARRYDTVEVGISEFEKLEGCVTCLSVRIRT